MVEAVIIAPVRTAIGKFGGSLTGVSAVELGAAAIRETLNRGQLDAGDVAAVVMGNVVQAGNRMNPARQATLHSGLHVTTPAVTVNRVCGSGAEAIASAVNQVWLGQGKAIVAGGMENMDRAPYLLPGARAGLRMGDAQVLDSMLLDGLHDAFSGQHSGWHTEDVARDWRISREDQDRWAHRSQTRFSEAQAAGKFAQEIASVEVQSKEGAICFASDETPRPDTTLEGLAKLRPVFRPGGTITAGNAPGLNSGAAAMIVADRQFADDRGLVPTARVVAHAVSALKPEEFALAPVFAIGLALERAGWSLAEVDRFEINEAYAVVPIAVAKSLGLPEDVVNVEGGAVAHGHPIGATGAILTTRLLHSMQRDGLKRGVVSLCIGGGQGIAIAAEMIS
ncbi:acetyl-CoA acetyltransferase (plasmid) [Rhizobium sp. ACO-34A]|nr:thiolase family protein [Rhizobium sp. ACO-34A]ATN37863.1 acetyl-CoA acetyltransferase [Rhizobium sp. ACO-34A]